MTLTFARATVRRWLPAVGPGLLMLALGLLGSTRPVLSWDEIATADAARRTVPQIWQLLHHLDGVFGPYYLLMHLWTRLAGDSVLSLRLPSILAMAAAAALTGELGRRLFGATIGTAAGTLLCLLPNMSRYAAEARPYAITCLFSILALLLLYRACERPGPGRWVGYAAAIIGLGAASLVSMTALSGHLMLVLLRDRRRATVWSWCAAAAAALIVLTPLVWWGLRERSAQLYWVPPLSPGGIYTFPALLVGSPETAWLLISLLMLAACRPSRPIIEMLAAAAVPAILLAVVSAAGPSFWINRYLLFVLLPAVIAAAAGLPRRVLGSAAILAVVAAAALPGQLAVRQPTVKNGTDYRTLAATIRQGQQPGDVIVYSMGRTMRTGVGYYLRRDDGRPLDVLLARTAAQTATLTAAEYPDPIPHLGSAARLWLVTYGHRTDPTTARRDLRPLLQRRYRRTRLWQVKGGTMALYTRTVAPGAAATATARPPRNEHTTATPTRNSSISTTGHGRNSG
jgi:mannosyltransferase